MRLVSYVRESLLAAGFLFVSMELWGCGTVPVIEQVPVSEPQPLSQLLQSRELSLDKIVFDVPRGTVVGETRRGNACVFPEDLKWPSNGLWEDGAYKQEFNRIAAEYHYRLVQNPTSLFERYKWTGNELVLGARITNVKENFCSGVTGWNHDKGHYRGYVRFSVQWEVFSVSRQKVVLVINTEASGQLEKFTLFGEGNYYERAFGHAVKGLLANRDFYRLVTSAADES